jgi:glucose dehydrogenase
MKTESIWVKMLGCDQVHRTDDHRLTQKPPDYVARAVKAEHEDGCRHRVVFAANRTELMKNVSRNQKFCRDCRTNGQHVTAVSRRTRPPEDAIPPISQSGSGGGSRDFRRLLRPDMMDNESCLRNEYTLFPVLRSATVL